MKIDREWAIHESDIGCDRQYLSDRDSVVRCKDCKYYDVEYRYCIGVPDIWTEPNGYCSWGERKETETKEEQL